MSATRETGSGPEAYAADVVRRSARGEISPPIALLRLLIACGGHDLLRSALIALAGPDQQPQIRHGARCIHGLLVAHPKGSATVLEMLRDDRAAGEFGEADAVEHCRRLFDQLVRLSPEASVALYSLGAPELLDAATQEVVALLDGLGVLRPDRRVLEIGCGIGRFQQALAGRVRAITGIDIAAGMIEEAKRRCAGLPNVTLRVTSGRDLAPFPSNSFDALLVIDAMPYLFRAGATLVETHVAESARVLRPGGDLVVLNFSYRGDLEADRREVRRLGKAADLCILRNGTADLQLWDGVTFHLRKAHQPIRSSMRP